MDWTNAAQLPALPTSLTAPPAATWPRPALWATVILLGIAFTLLAWNAYASSRWATRPAALERGALARARLDLRPRRAACNCCSYQDWAKPLAARQEAYRDEHNGFRDLDELRQVRGIGPALIEKLRPLVCVVPFDSDEESEPRPPPAPMIRQAKSAPPSKPATTKKPTELNGPIDVNRAGVEELKRLPGIGPTLSERIVEARKVAPFTKVDELRRVKGIGAKTLENLRPLVTVGPAETAKKD